MRNEHDTKTRGNGNGRGNALRKRRLGLVDFNFALITSMLHDYRLVEASGGLLGGQFILRVQQGASRPCHWVYCLLLRNVTTRRRRTQDPYLLVLRSLVENICDGKCIHADIIHW
jgi:hypothetical protein